MPQDKFVTLSIDGKQISVSSDMTILAAAKEIGVDIPTICYHPALTANGLCRQCVVEVEGESKLAASCVTQVSDEMVVRTNSEEVSRIRKTILEMLDASVNLSEAPDLQNQIETYRADPDRFPYARKRGTPLIDDNPFYVRDYEQCVQCWGCVQACGDDLQYTYALSVGGRGFDSDIATYFENPMPETTCVFCGNCVAVCPTGALKGKGEYFLEMGLNYDQIREEKRKQKKKR
jgi:NADH dehydrogenase/NADH:ubiquinone oxidoreductase subunit G